jgi:hypothetical protein
LSKLRASPNSRSFTAFRRSTSTGNLPKPEGS